MAQKNRYLINYKEVNGTWEKVFAKGIKEANELYVWYDWQWGWVQSFNWFSDRKTDKTDTANLTL